MKHLNASRREFLRNASALSMAGVATPFALNLASIGAASGQAADYKALVCVFLYGANDAHNTVVPFDDASYAPYAAARPTLRWDKSIPTELQVLAPTAGLPAGKQLALPAQLAGIKTLFDQGRCAIVSNVGPLIEPTNRTQYLARSVPLPPKLFSHNDQQSVWQASAPEGARFGWGGRIGDLLASRNTTSALTCMSPSGNAVFLSGTTVQPFQFDATTGAIAFNALTSSTLFGSTTSGAVLRNSLRRTRTHLFEGELANVNNRSITINSQLATALAAQPPLTTLFPSNNSLGSQLSMAARMIAVRGALNMQRQVFFVSQGGFDTHAAQDTGHPGLLTSVNDALAAFYQATVELGIASSVTTFTASDFGRTLVENGDGTDHGWGSHHFVIGGAVNGNRVFGTYPELALNGAQDAGNGRLIPTTAVEQYAATFATWMGVSSTDLPIILPNLPNFAPNNLGFMA